MTHLFLVELELEAQEFVQGLLVWGVVPEEINEKVVLVQLALEALQDNVQHPVGVQIEVPDDGLDDL